MKSKLVWLSGWNFILTALCVVVFLPFSHAAEQSNDHSHTNSQNDHLHFSHPLISESPTPDTKVRFDYLFGNLENGEQEQTLQVEAEYAFSKHFSVEVVVPYTFRDPTDSPNQNNLGNIELGFKLASFAFAQHGVILGGGLEFTLPTGDDNKEIGTDHGLTVEPFISAGFKQNDFEVVGFLGFGIPTNQPSDEKDDEDLELGFNIAVSYHVTTHLTALFEIDGEAIVSGDDNETVVNLTPGIKIRPTGDPDLEVGIGLSFPISNDKEFESQLIVSLLHHFH